MDLYIYIEFYIYIYIYVWYMYNKENVKQKLDSFLICSAVVNPHIIDMAVLEFEAFFAAGDTTG